MTETQTVDLAAWLTAIWDEEERLARAAPQQPWFSTLESGDDAENFGSVWIDTDGTWKNADTIADWYKPGVGEHIAYHDPASVLARIAADRKILELHRNDYGGCPVCVAGEDFSDDSEGNRAWYSVMAKYPCPTLRLLASPYKGREGWQEIWE